MIAAQQAGPALAAPVAYARVRVGSQALAIPADQVLQAGPWPAGGLLPVPRRGGALAGMCPHEGGLLPVVALERWCPMAPAGTAPAAATDSPSGDDRRLLVLRSGHAVVGLAADAVLGVSPAPATGLVRLHHEDEEHELFQSAVMLGGEPTCVLEVGRLTRLARVWADLARLDGQAPGADAGAAEAGAGPQPAAVPHAVLSAGGLLAALPVHHLRQVVAAPPLEIDFGRGASVRGLCQWSQRKLPVIDLAQRLCATPPAGPLPRWMAVVSVDGAMAGLLIDEACQLLPLSPPPPADDAALPPGLLPPLMTVLGAVQPLDAAALLAGLPMAVQPASATAALGASAAAQAARGSPAYVVFEADGLYASPVDGIAAIVPLPEDSADRLLAGHSCTLPWRGQLLPLQLLPRYGGAGAVQQLPSLAVVLAPPGGRPAALAIGRLVSWVPANTATTAGMRMAALGELQMISVGRPGAAASYMVLDLAQLAFLLT